MESWNLREQEAPHGARSPVVLHTADEARAVLIVLEPGQSLGDHEVKENAYLTVIEGSVRVESPDRTMDATAGTFLVFGPSERHAITSDGGARLLLLLAPWPGEGHYRGEEMVDRKT